MASSPVAQLPSLVTKESINLSRFPVTQEKRGVLSHQYPSHLEDGKWYWNPREIILMPVHGLLSQNLNAFLRRQTPCCNANIAPTFSNAGAISQDWEDKTIYLFGTVFVEKPWDESVLALFKTEGKWEERYVSLREPVAHNAEAAVFHF